ncbi:MAG: phospho-N-acetylmuramoyl-pentapeptide-transferase [Candidatus Aureabacteria bacterium]|nr:phospho-N-acetylmuramoyl-pentapeptide-transferase [Candidatus Auribacterota bacterium]
MFYYLFYPLKEFWFGFNIFRYITFRAAGAAIMAFVLTLLCGGRIIEKLRSLKVGEKIRNGRHYEALYEKHKGKEGTPTMGGVIILFAVMASVLCWARLDNLQTQLIVLSTLALGLIGIVDDWLKLRTKTRGLPGRVKLLGQVAVGLVVSIVLLRHPLTASWAGQLSIPFIKHPLVADLGLFAIPFTILVLVGTTNAVNLTDGLDGLAVGCLAIAALACSVMAYVTGHISFAGYLQILYIPGAGELAVFCAALAGASLGFLWFNCHPASVFMGDTGALACGGALGMVAVLIKKEFFLAIVGGVFVLEALSVILQVLSFKCAGKRIFAMSPLHHHFEMKGVPDRFC